ncbi:MAG: type II secretion system F family protein [Acidobacteriota bacterium]|jgi:type IV pilus assembly protein PilC
MAEFACRIGSEGGISERLVMAPSAERARELLAEQGLEVFAVRRHDGMAQRLRGLATARREADDLRADTTLASIARRPLFSRHGIPTRDLLLLTEELAALFRAGLPLLKCIDILRGRRSGTPTGAVLDRVRERIAGGSSLSGAFAAEPSSSRIPRLFVTSLTIGESSGDLEGALRRYAHHLERAQTLRSRVRGALLYPAALFCVSLGVIGVLIGFVLPRFADFYASYEAQLPLPTRVLMSVAGFAQDHGRMALTILVVGGLSLLLASRSASGRVARERIGLRLPLIGPLRRLYLDVESSRTMATLLRGGAPLTEAIVVAADGTDNSIYRERLRRVGELVSQGNSLHASLELTGLMDSMGLEMVEVGESTGTLEEMLGHIAESYDEILERRLNTAVGLLEPAVLVTMGLFLAAVLLSLYLPLFNVVQVV